MTLTEEEIKQVQDSWEIAKKLGVDTIGRVFYQRVFSKAPEALKMFSFRDNDNMFESESFKKHARGVVMTVGRAVAGLRDINSILPSIMELGARHNKYGVKPEHYPIIGEALLDTIEQGTGDKFTPAVRKAWETTYNMIADAMMLGQAKEAEKENAGNDNAKKDQAEKEHAEKHHGGKHHAGKDHAGKDHAGKDHAGKDHASSHPKEQK